MRNAPKHVNKAAKEQRKAIVKIVIDADFCDEAGAMNVEAIGIAPWAVASDLFDTVLNSTVRRKDPA